MYDIKKGGGLLFMNKNNTKQVKQLKITNNDKWVKQREYIVKKINNYFVQFIFIREIIIYVHHLTFHTIQY